MSRSSEKMRRGSALGDERRDAGLTTPAYIRRFDDIQYGPDPDWNVLDVYRNRYLTGKLPVILIVHGGGWVYGSKETYQFYGIELAKRGFAVVNYSYRLAPEHKFPASLEDTVNVSAWLMSHASEFGFDTDRIFAVGDSAGGNLLGLFCAFLHNEEYRSQFPFWMPEEAERHFRLKAVGMNCGAYQLFNQEGHIDRPDDLGFMADLLMDPEEEEEAEADGELSKAQIDDLITKERKYIDVAARVNRDFPPAYIMTCEGDFLKAQAPILQAAYQKAGAKSELHIFGTKEKPLYHVFHCTVQEPEGQKCNDEECDFFRKYF